MEDTQYQQDVDTINAIIHAATSEVEMSYCIGAMVGAVMLHQGATALPATKSVRDSYFEEYGMTKHPNEYVNNFFLARALAGNYPKVTKESNTKKGDHAHAKSSPRANQSNGTASQGRGVV